MRAPIYKMGDLSSEILDDASNDVSELNTSDAVEEDKPVKSVKEGKQGREKGVNTSKKNVRKKKQEALQALDDKKDALNIDAIESSGKKTNYDDSSERKAIKAEKRRAMQDIRDTERGQIRTDRRNRGIERMGNRYNMSTEDATKAYDTRTSTYAAYNVNAANQNSINAMKQKDEEGNKDTLGDKILAAPGSTLGKTKLDTNSAGNVQANITPSKPNKSPVDMLAPTQQEASEDSQGIASFMMNSKNRRGY